MGYVQSHSWAGIAEDRKAEDGGVAVDFDGSGGGRAGEDDLDRKAEEPASGPEGGDSMLLKACTIERNFRR